MCCSEWNIQSCVVHRYAHYTLPQRVVFGELVGGKGYSGGQEKNGLVHLKEDMSVFGIKFEGSRKAAQKVGRWFRQVEGGVELFMRTWHETERRRAAERHKGRGSAIHSRHLYAAGGRG